MKSVISLAWRVQVPDHHYAPQSPATRVRTAREDIRGLEFLKVGEEVWDQSCMGGSAREGGAEEGVGSVA